MKHYGGVLVAVLALTMFAAGVAAAPTGPIGPQTLTRVSDSRLDISDYAAATTAADAGNITQLTINGTTQTMSWAGFYGNITGVIVLDDASGWTFYNWNLAEPQGEIYASNGTISDWSTVHCFNYSNNGTQMTYTYDAGSKTTIEQNPLNLSILEANFGILTDDNDGVDETFNTLGNVDVSVPHTGFFVGTIQIVAGTCPATDTFENDTSLGSNFQEVLLITNNSHNVIFASIIENDDNLSTTDVRGYNNQSTDFQLLVLENGQDGAGQDTATTYYFYVELE